MQSAKLSFTARSTSKDLVLTVRLDDILIFIGSVNPDSQLIEFNFDDSQESDHFLEIEMSGKTPAHTIIDDQGNIINDHFIIIDDILFDGIPTGNIFTDLAEYHHDFNKTRSPTVEKFYGTIGCNGIIKLKFSTPIYLWMLENM